MPFTGLRVSELLGIEVERYRFRDAEVHVSRAIVYGVVGRMQVQSLEEAVPLGPGASQRRCNGWPHNQSI